MSILFSNISENIWEAITPFGKYRCFYTGTKWTVFFNDIPIATRLDSLHEAHDYAMKHNITTEDIAMDISSPCGCDGKSHICTCKSN